MIPTEETFMNKRSSFLVGAFFAATMALTACSNSSDSSAYYDWPLTQGFPNNGSNSSCDFSGKELNVDYGENATDSDLAAVSWTSEIYLNLTEKKYSTDNSTWTAISSDASNPSDVTTKVSIYNDSGYIKISATTTDALKFVLTGTLDGELFFANKKDGVIGIFMNDASITSGNYPCIEFDKKGIIYLNLTGTNSLTDGRKYGKAYSSEHSSVSGYIEKASESKGTFHAKGNLNISASDSLASLTIKEGYKHGIFASGIINFYGGIVTVNSTGRNGFQCKAGFNMIGGTAIVYGSGTNTNNQSRGIVVEGDDTCEIDNCGYFKMTGGSVNIKTVSKGITAKWDASEDASTDASKIKNTVNPVVTISGGTINIITYGTPIEEESTASSFKDADGETVSEKIKLSPEGIEGKAGVTITSGTIHVVTTDDCINASASSSAIKISGGTVYAYSGSNDAIDSNGSVTISGGTIVALTATTPECAFDCDQNTFAVTGGTFIGIGTSNYSAPTASACSQSVIVLGGSSIGSGGTTFALEDSSGAAVFAFTIPSDIYSSLGSDIVTVFSSPNIAAGTSYTLYSGVTVNGGSATNGLYTTLPTVSGGTATATGISTTTSNYVYTLATTSMGAGGEQPGGPNR